MSIVSDLYMKIDEQASEIRRLHGIIDGLLGHCGDGECMDCGAIVCPYGEPLHFHHDGCPACCQFEDDQHD